MQQAINAVLFNQKALAHIWIMHGKLTARGEITIIPIQNAPADMTPQHNVIIITAANNDDTGVDNLKDHGSRARDYIIKNLPSCLLNNQGVSFGSDGSVESLYPQMEKDMRSVAQAMGCIEYLPPLRCAQKVVAYMYHQFDMCVTLFVRAAFIL
jgi:hypothetical protein